jgi:hypothetical protein
MNLGSAGGFPSFGAAPEPPATGLSKIKIGACIVCVLALVGTYVLLRKPSVRSNASPAGVGSVPVPVGSAPQQQASGPLTSAALGGEVSADIGERYRTDPPENVLASFAFEPLLRPGYVPNKKAFLAKKPVGNPLYKLVNCSTVNAYGIRWNSRYLVVENGIVKWSETLGEPIGCWRLVPGQCGGDKHVMLRNIESRQFLRAEETNGRLVCRDGPTSRTAKYFCWKVNVDTTGKQPCGTQYSYDLGRVINVPCNVKEMPPPGGSCSSVTPGYQASCCEKRGSTSDAFCGSTYFPQVVGRSLQEAMLYIRTRFPQLIIKPCAEPCGMQAIPVQNANMIVIPFDAKTNLVTSPARRLV